MNVQVSNLALVFGAQAESGYVVKVLWHLDISEALGSSESGTTETALCPTQE